MKKIRLGTRGSKLALIQTDIVIRAIAAHHPDLEKAIEIVPIKTTGDVIVDRSLTDLGGKSLFTKEIELALTNHDIDIAVHSMKDVTADFQPGLIFPALLEREDPRDALITKDGKKFEDFPPGSLFGTSSLRRQAFVRNKYPHFRVENLRGNVPTRFQKIMEGEYDATLLAAAGLKRLGMLELATQVLSIDEFIPAVAQGALGIQCREEDGFVTNLLKPLNHLTTYQAVTAERAFLRALNGSCRTPIAGYAHIEEETLQFKGMVSESDGQNMKFVTLSGSPLEAEKIGLEAANQIRG